MQPSEVQKPETGQKTGPWTNRKFLWINQYVNTNWNFFDRTKCSKDIDHMALDGLSSQLFLFIKLAKINLRGLNLQKDPEQFAFEIVGPA